MNLIYAEIVTVFQEDAPLMGKVRVGGAQKYRSLNPAGGLSNRSGNRFDVRRRRSRTS